MFDACSWHNMRSVGRPSNESNSAGSFRFPMSPTICASKKLPPGLHDEGYAAAPAYDGVGGQSDNARARPATEPATPV